MALSLLPQLHTPTRFLSSSSLSLACFAIMELWIISPRGTFPCIGRALVILYFLSHNIITCLSRRALVDSLIAPSCRFGLFGSCARTISRRAGRGQLI